jgi:hypothetical protein
VLGDLKGAMEIYRGILAAGDAPRLGSAGTDRPRALSRWRLHRISDSEAAETTSPNRPAAPKLARPPSKPMNGFNCAARVAAASAAARWSWGNSPVRVGNLYQSISAAANRGKTVRLRAWLRLEER